MFDTKEGNWGTMTQPAAAYRYTNTRLTKYSDRVFFDPFYLPMVKMVPNFDGSTVEPLILPALLPNALLNGNFGIAPGVNTRSPSFTLESVIALIQKMLKDKQEPTAKDCLDLVLTTRYGGRVIKSKGQRSELLRLYKTGKAKVVFDSTLTVMKDGSIRINRFAPIGDIEKLLAKVEGIKGVAAAKDDSDKLDPFGTAYLIKLGKGVKEADREDIIKKIRLAFRASWQYNVKVTDRFVDEKGQGAAKLRHSTPPQILIDWLKYRLQLEQEACAYWIVETDKKIEYLRLMQLAIKHIDFIVKCLKDKSLKGQELDDKVAKGLKITVAQAKSILDRPIRQLRALEYDDLQAKIDEHERYKAELRSRKDKPAKYVYKHVGDILVDLLAKKSEKTSGGQS
jgi:DNA gyrase/topoisomerase IV subunit A